jgi:hypothetical protein
MHSPAGQSHLSLQQLQQSAPPSRQLHLYNFTSMNHNIIEFRSKFQLSDRRFIFYRNGATKQEAPLD